MRPSTTRRRDASSSIFKTSKSLNYVLAILLYFTVWLLDSSHGFQALPTTLLEKTPARPSNNSLPSVSTRRRQSLLLFASTAKTTTVSATAAEKKIDGKAIAADIRQELKEEIETTMPDSPPGLAVILVGGRRDSQTYVNMKKKACAQVGIASFGFDYDETVAEEELLAKIDELNDRSDVHGILVQLPLPAYINEQRVLNAVSPEKDVDGLHPQNIAKLALQGTHNNHQGDWEDLSNIPFSVPCTPLGCLELLDRSDVSIAGKHAVVIGRSNLVGLPISFLLLHRDATVTIVHSKTQNIEEQVGSGDIVIAAVGRAKLVKASWLKEGAVVIDVGINSVDLPPELVKEGKRPYKLVGDVDYESALEKCSKITPVPGGVGPMTIAMLLRNTLNACKRSNKAL
jgi:5,10-methylene-tetrahydrofolate dehydrogenase/methenyl tetrahydrofolate cyclohydrolase